jgi:hypothetical protein
LRGGATAPVGRAGFLDNRFALLDFSFMAKTIQVDAEWDDEAHVWIATSYDAPGLLVEAETWQSMIDEARAVLPEVLKMNEGFVGAISVIFRAETRLALAPPGVDSQASHCPVRPSCAIPRMSC